MSRMAFLKKLFEKDFRVVKVTKIIFIMKV